jgi:hypothetical protein
MRAVRARRRSRAIVDAVFARADKLSIERATLPKSPLGKALGYLDRQRDRYRPFSAMRASRSSTTTRNVTYVTSQSAAMNWQIFGSARGGEVACRLYSLILSCKQNSPASWRDRQPSPMCSDTGVT